MDTEDYVDCSGWLVLECKKCWEQMVLLGLEEDWRLEGKSFECGCGASLTLADRRDNETSRIRHLFSSNTSDPTTWGTRNYDGL